MKRRHSITLCLLLSVSVTQGCSEDDPDQDAVDTGPASSTASDEPVSDTGSTSEDASGDDSSSGPGLDVDALYDCVDPDFTVFTPLAGPGYDPQTGFTEPLAEEYVVHTTQLLVKEEQFSEFLTLSDQVTEQLQQTPGLVAVGIASDPNCGFQRTLGIWSSEADMYTFAATGAHAIAMSSALSISATGKVTHWTVAPEDGLITWEQAMERLSAVPPSAIYD